jgi:hypothetical protein
MGEDGLPCPAIPCRGDDVLQGDEVWKMSDGTYVITGRGVAGPLGAGRLQRRAGERGGRYDGAAAAALPTQATFFLLRIDDPADGRPPDLQARNTDRGLSCMPLRKYKPRTAFPGVIGRTADRHRPDDRSAEFSMAAAAPFGCRPPGRGFERSYGSSATTPADGIPT